jgi:hypothetical protein
LHKAETIPDLKLRLFITELIDSPNRLRNLTLVINHTEQIGVFLGVAVFHQNRIPNRQTL